MPAKRKYNQSSSGSKKYKSYKKTYNRSRMGNDGAHMPVVPGLRRFVWSMKKDTMVYPHARTIDLAAYTTSIAGATNAVYSFSLDQVTNYTEFTNLYDQYRIKRVDIQMRRMGNSESTAAIDGVIYVAPDYDDVAATAVAALQQYPAVQCLNWDEGCQIELYPRIAMAAYAGAFTSYANVAAGWIDCNSPSVAHYGLKIAANGFGGVPQKWEITATYHLEFRSPR